MSHSGSGFTAPLRDLALIFGLEVRTTATKFGLSNQDLFCFVLQFPRRSAPSSNRFLFFYFSGTSLSIWEDSALAVLQPIRGITLVVPLGWTSYG